MFALRFKSVEQAARFKEVFDEAKNSSPDANGIDYVIIRTVGATASLDVKSKHVKLLSAGDAVRIREVTYSVKDQRVRGQLVRPAGWITIMSHNASDEASYAVRSRDLDEYLGRTKCGLNSDGT